MNRNISKKEVLINARKLIEKPENWTKQFYATDENGCRVDWIAECATCFCATGAIKRAIGDLDRQHFLERFAEDKQADQEYIDLHLDISELMFKILKKVVDADAYVIPSLINWNDDDNREHPHVMALFDKAIENCHG